MHDTAKRGVVFAVATGGLLLAGAAQAHADTAVAIAEQHGAATAARLDSGAGPLRASAQTSGDARAAEPRSQGSARRALLKRRYAADPSPSGGIASGDRIDIPVALSLNLCGNGVALLGRTVAAAACSAQIPGTAITTGSAVQSGGLLSGIAAEAPITVPANVCGNLVSVAGVADSGPGSTCSVAAVAAASSSVAASSASAAASAGEAGSAVDGILGGVLSGIAVGAPITAPVNFCGNTVGAVGAASAAVTCSFGQSGTSSSSADASQGASDTGSGPQSASTSLTLSQTVPAAPQQAAPQQAAVPVPEAAAAPVAPAAAPQAAAPASELQPDAPSVQPAAPENAGPDTVAGQQPVTVHPMIVWPRPRSASLKISGTGPMHSAPALHASRLLGGSTLAQTGAHTAIPAGAAALALTGGIGLRALGRHGRGSRHSTNR